MREEEQTTRRRKPSLYTCVLILVVVLVQLTCVLTLTLVFTQLTCIHTSLMQQNKIIFSKHPDQRRGIPAVAFPLGHSHQGVPTWVFLSFQANFSDVEACTVVTAAGRSGEF